MVAIRELQIELPEELAHRSQAIIHFVEAGCRDLKWSGDAPTELNLSDVLLKPGADNAWIAEQILAGLKQHAVKGR